MTDDERRRAVLFNDITFAPLSGRGHLMFSDRMRLRDYLWEQGWRREVRPEDATELREPPLGSFDNPAPFSDIPKKWGWKA